MHSLISANLQTDNHITNNKIRIYNREETFLLYVGTCACTHIHYISESSVSHINGVWPVFLFEQLFAVYIPSG